MQTIHRSKTYHCSSDQNKVPCNVLPACLSCKIVADKDTASCLADWKLAIPNNDYGEERAQPGCTIPCALDTLSPEYVHRMTSKFLNALQYPQACSFAKLSNVSSENSARSTLLLRILWQKVCSRSYSASLLKPVLKNTFVWIFTSHTVLVIQYIVCSVHFAGQLDCVGLNETCNYVHRLRRSLRSQPLVVCPLGVWESNRSFFYK